MDPKGLMTSKKKRGRTQRALSRCNKNGFVTSAFFSKVMMLEVLQHLHKNNKVFPPEFAMSNDFLVSYLFLYE